MGQASSGSSSVIFVDKTVVVGKIGAPYGVQGWVKVHSFTQPGENLFGYPLLFEAHSGVSRSVKIEQFKPHGDSFVAKLADINDRDAAALITNSTVVVYRKDLPELDSEEFYLEDLIGLSVYNQDNIKLGQVKDFFETGANEVLVVQDEAVEHLIPFVPEMFVLNIDLPGKQMQVRWDLEI